jgi:hypothetical protein
MKTSSPKTRYIGAVTLFVFASALLVGSTSRVVGQTEPASLLAVFVADDGAKLTTFD